MHAFSRVACWRIRHWVHGSLLCRQALRRRKSLGSTAKKLTICPNIKGAAPRSPQIAQDALHPPHRQTLINLEVFRPIPPACLARELLSMQGRLIYNKQIHLLKQNLSETITQIVNSCMLLFNPSVDPVVC